VTGDFNAGEDNPAVTALTRGAGGASPPFVDAFRRRHPDAVDVSTFTGFECGRRDRLRESVGEPADGD
jgi:hypothetical protein